MPELAALFLIGQIITWIETAYFGFQIKKGARQSQLVDQNLQIAGLAWDRSTDEIIPVQKLKNQKGQFGLTKSFFLLGFVLSFFSWFGVFGVLILYFAFLRISKSSLHVTLTDSKLNSVGPFTENDVLSILNDLQIDPRTD